MAKKPKIKTAKDLEDGGRLKLMLSGDAGVGKTVASLKMPKPFIIDTERGTDHYGDLLKASDGGVLQTTDFNEIVDAVKWLLAGDHDYLTLVLDSETKLYHLLGDEGERKVGTEFFKHYKQYADKLMRRLNDLVDALDMNVVITGHEKNQWGKDKDGNPTIVGTTYDGPIKQAYEMDLWLELVRTEDPAKREAIVRKTRLAGFPDGDRFVWEYAELAKRFGKKLLEAKVKGLELANQDQVDKLRFLVHGLTDDELKKLKLHKLDLDTLVDMPADRLSKGIKLIEDYKAEQAA